MEQGTSRLQQSATVWIDCTPEEAFAYVADFTTHPAWSPDDMRVLSAPDGLVRVGSRCRTVGFSAVRGGDVEADVEVTVFDPPTRLEFVATSGPQSFFNTITFASDNQGTLVERTVAFDAPPQLAERVRAVEAETGRRREAGLEMLKERLEGR